MAKWIDLSQLIYEGMSYIPSFPEPCIRTHTSVEETGINVMQITIMTHMGTHIDAPLHFIRGGETIDRFEVDRFTGRGVVLDMTREELAPITADDLEKATPRPERGDIVLLRTGWGRLYGQGDGYLRHPHLTGDAAQWLVDNGISMVGVDALSVDLAYSKRTPDFTFPVHNTLLNNNVLIIENLADPLPLVGRYVTVNAFPIKVKDADGAPARVVASPLD